MREIRQTIYKMAHTLHWIPHALTMDYNGESVQIRFFTKFNRKKKTRKIFSNWKKWRNLTKNEPLKMKSHEKFTRNDFTVENVKIAMILLWECVYVALAGKKSINACILSIHSNHFYAKNRYFTWIKFPSGKILPNPTRKKTMICFWIICCGIESLFISAPNCMHYSGCL